MRLYLLSDDELFKEGFAERLREQHFDVLFKANASAFDDLCAMMASQTIIKASVASQFSSIAAALSGKPLISFANLSQHAARFALLDKGWQRDGLLDVTWVDFQAAGAR